MLADCPPPYADISAYSYFNYSLRSGSNSYCIQFCLEHFKLLGIEKLCSGFQCSFRCFNFTKLFHAGNKPCTQFHTLGKGLDCIQGIFLRRCIITLIVKQADQFRILLYIFLFVIQALLHDKSLVSAFLGHKFSSVHGPEFLKQLYLGIL